MSVVLAIPFVSFHGIYLHNGGLSDFRMDLHLYLLFGCSVCWFTIAAHTGRLQFWALCGAFCGLAALARATAPVYLIVVFAPALCLRLILRQSEFVALIKGCLVAGGIAIGLAGWFFVFRYNDLYYYYVVWNADANAHLPLETSIRHFSIAFQQVGSPILLSFLFALAVSIDWDQFHFKGIVRYVRQWPYEFALAALMPAGFLAIRGAGLNPFVSMPSTFGIIGLLLLGIQNWSGTSLRRCVVAAVIILAGCALSAYRGYGDHAFGYEGNQMAGYKKIIKTINKDADPKTGEVVTARFMTLGVGYLTNVALRNVLLFDMNGRQLVNRNIRRKQVIFNDWNSGPFNLATFVEWRQIKGERDVDKIHSLVRSAAQFDYFILPTDRTAKHLSERVGFNYINNYLPWLKRRMISDLDLEPIADEFEINESEQYRIYKRADGRKDR